MFSVRQSDLLLALKKFRRLAKQDLLASPLTSEPAFWQSQAESRREQYDEIMQCVEEKGVEPAYRELISQYVDLPLLRDEKDPSISGREQAFEMYFAALGLSEKEKVRLRNARRKNAPWKRAAYLDASHRRELRTEKKVRHLHPDATAAKA